MTAGLHVVLFEPEIPQNTGNIARTCVCTGAVLHVVEPMGFRMTERTMKRAGLDYWDEVEIVRHASVKQFLSEHAGCQLLFFTGHADMSFYDAGIDADEDLYLVFGRESRGIDPEVLDAYASSCVRLPMRPEMRSLNLSNAVAIGLYETLRRRSFPGLA